MSVVMPRVSVCVVTYNRSSYLRGAIESVLAQTFGDFELLVLDDCSTDDTQAVVANYRDPRLRSIRNERNRGEVGNKNHCLALARAPYIAILDDDDLYLPTMLESTVGALSAHPEAAFAYGSVEVIDNDGRLLETRHSLPIDQVLDPSTAFAHILLFNTVPPPTVLVRSQAYAAVGGYDEAIGWSIDWDMWLRLASRYPVVYLNRVLARMRLSDESQTRRGEADGSAWRSLRATLRKALASPPLGKRPPYHIVRRARLWVAGYELQIAFDYLYRGDYRSFRKHTLAALTFTPELMATKGGLAALVLGAATVFGHRGPGFLWMLRDRTRDLHQLGRR